MRNSEPSGGSTATTLTTPQPQGPPNYPGPGGRANLNPPFDPRMLSTGGANPALKDRPLKRGRIVAVTGGLQINFMFNPSVLNVSYAFDDSNPDQSKADPTVNPDLPGQGQLSVDLLFDRTYEVWERATTNAAAVYGVHTDILTFYAFLGMIPDDYTVNSGWETLYPRSQIRRQDSYLYIGDRLKYYGYVTSLTVQYTHWSYDMVPVRAAVNIGFSVLLSTPTSTSTSPSSSSGSTTTKPQEAIPGKDYPVLPVG